MAVQVRPLQDRVIVKRVEEKEERERRRHHHPRRREGEAPGGQDVKVGDRILFGKYSGTDIKLDGEEHLILREEDILGVLEA